MKRIIRFILLGSIVSAACLTGLFFWYSSHLNRNLQEELGDILELRMDIKSIGLERLELTGSLVHLLRGSCNANHLGASVLANRRDREGVVDLNDLWDLDYDTNEKLMTIYRCAQQHILLSDSIFAQLEQSADQLNDILYRYNNRVKKYNRKVSVFPNLLLTLRNGFEREDYFYLKYGELNIEILRKKNSMEHWVETGEWEK